MANSGYLDEPFVGYVSVGQQPYEASSTITITVHPPTAEVQFSDRDNVFGFNAWGAPMSVVEHDGLLYLSAPGTPYDGMLLVAPSRDAEALPSGRQVMLRRRQ